MKLYQIKSPSGQILRIWADSVHHAIQLAQMAEDWKFTPVMYYHVNQLRP